MLLAAVWDMGQFSGDSWNFLSCSGFHKALEWFSLGAAFFMAWRTIFSMWRELLEPLSELSECCDPLVG